MRASAGAGHQRVRCFPGAAGGGHQAVRHRSLQDAHCHRAQGHHPCSGGPCRSCSKLLTCHASVAGLGSIHVADTAALPTRLQGRAHLSTVVLSTPGCFAPSAHPRSPATLQVKQSQEHLLERLISYVHNLEPTQLEHLLEEDQEVTQKRAAAQMSLQVGPGRGAAAWPTALCCWGLQCMGAGSGCHQTGAVWGHATGSAGGTEKSVLCQQFSTGRHTLWCRTFRRPSGS